MRHALTATALALLSLTVIAVAQNPLLKFEVASVKASYTRSGGSGVGCYFPTQRIDLAPKGMCIAKNATLRSIMAEAYGISIFNMSDYILGGPGWIGNDKFDIEAKAEDLSASTDQLHAMLLNLLVERFKLEVHEVKKDESGFALVIGKNGAKLTPSTGDRPVGVNAGGQPPRELAGINTSMAGLVRYLSIKFKRPMIDRTGLTGTYDFKVALLTDEPPHTLNESDISAVAKGLEQLGLRLQPEKLPVVRVVIDRAEKPDAN